MFILLDNGPYALTSPSRHRRGKLMMVKQWKRADLYLPRTGLAYEHLTFDLSARAPYSTDVICIRSIQANP